MASRVSRSISDDILPRDKTGPAATMSVSDSAAQDGRFLLRFLGRRADASCLHLEKNIALHTASESGRLPIPACRMRGSQKIFHQQVFVAPFAGSNSAFDRFAFPRPA